MSSRIKLLRNTLGITQEEFVSPLKITQSALSLIEKGGGVSSETVSEISKQYDVNINWLINGEGEMLLKVPALIKENSYNGTLKPAGNIIHVPLYAYGGFLSGYANKVYLDSLERFTLPGIHGQHFSFEVQGSSMISFAYPGEKAITRPEESFQNMIKNRAYVLQTIDGILIKFFNGIKGENGIFASANSEYDDIKIHLKELKKIYQVVEIRVDPYLRYDFDKK